MAESTGFGLEDTLKNDTERDMIIAHFKGNDALLKSLRALLLSLPTTQEERDAIRALPDGIKKIIRERLMPVLDRERPIGIMSELIYSLNNPIREGSEFGVKQSIAAFEKFYHLIKNALSLLDNPDGPAPEADYDPLKLIWEDAVMGTSILAHNRMVSDVNHHIHALKLIADMKIENEKEKSERLKKSSSK